MQLLCRNVVADYDAWREVFDLHAEARRGAGLELVKMWRGADDDHDIFFLFDITSRRRAQAFMDDPSAAETGRRAGVLGGEYHFLDEVPVS